MQQPRTVECENSSVYVYCTYQIHVTRFFQFQLASFPNFQLASFPPFRRCRFHRCSPVVKKFHRCPNAFVYYLSTLRFQNSHAFFPFTTFSTSHALFLIPHSFAITTHFHFHPFHHRSPLPQLTRLIH